MISFRFDNSDMESREDPLRHLQQVFSNPLHQTQCLSTRHEQALQMTDDATYARVQKAQHGWGSLGDPRATYFEYSIVVR